MGWLREGLVGAVDLVHREVLLVAWDPVVVAELNDVATGDPWDTVVP